MSNYCPQCGKRIPETNARFCPSCGASLDTSSFNSNNADWKKTTYNQIPPAADTIMSLNKVAGILCILLGIFFLIIGIFTLIVFVGIFFLIIAFINFLIRAKLNEINNCIKNAEYQKAKNDQLMYMIIGFIFGGIIIGIILLIGYLKYDDLYK